MLATSTFRGRLTAGGSFLLRVRNNHILEMTQHIHLCYIYRSMNDRARVIISETADLGSDAEITSKRTSAIRGLALHRCLLRCLQKVATDTSTSVYSGLKLDPRETFLSIRTSYPSARNNKHLTHAQPLPHKHPPHIIFITMIAYKFLAVAFFSALTANAAPAGLLGEGGLVPLPPIDFP